MQVGLMQEYNEPMPGLLYEAELPGHNPPPGTSANGGTQSRQPRGGGQNQGVSIASSHDVSLPCFAGVIHQTPWLS